MYPAWDQRTNSCLLHAPYRGYSTTHSRRQHYRRHHRHQWTSLRTQRGGASSTKASQPASQAASPQTTADWDRPASSSVPKHAGEDEMASRVSQGPSPPLVTRGRALSSDGKGAFSPYSRGSSVPPRVLASKSAEHLGDSVPHGSTTTGAAKPTAPVPTPNSLVSFSAEFLLAPSPSPPTARPPQAPWQRHPPAPSEDRSRPSSPPVVQSHHHNQQPSYRPYECQPPRDVPADRSLSTPMDQQEQAGNSPSSSRKRLTKVVC